MFFQANSLRFSDWHLGFSRIPISSSNTGTSTKPKPIYVPPLILTGFYTWGVSCQYRYILLQSSTFVDASQDTFGCDTKIIWRTTGWTAGGIDKDLGCLIGYLLGSVILVADPWLQGLVTKILKGAGTHNAQTPRKIYCRVFSEEACGQFSIKFVHKCIVWTAKIRHWTILPMPLATTSSSPHVALRHRQEQLPHRCKWCLSPGALDGLNDKISPEIPSTIGV